MVDNLQETTYGELINTLKAHGYDARYNYVESNNSLMVYIYRRESEDYGCFECRALTLELSFTADSIKDIDSDDMLYEIDRML